ncbi:FecR/PupR family sigma factor regulator [Paraburkholderia tropica]|nr:DUF4880 domain-containing protein [Paraburkholderia tropica]
MNASPEPIDARILEEAADWLVKLNAASVSDEDLAACACWQRIDAEHARA